MSRKDSGINDIPYDPDLHQILEYRIAYRLKHLYDEMKKTLPEVAKAHGKNPKNIKFHKENLETFLGVCWEEIIDKELAAFSRELDRYEKKHKTGYFDNIEAARNGNNRLLYRLLKWDKSWIAIDWVKKRIIEAQVKYDDDFLRNIGEAFQSLPGFRSKPRKDIELIEKLKKFADFYGYGKGELEPIKGMHDYLTDKVIVEDEKYDFNYFVKWLRRHKVIS